MSIWTRGICFYSFSNVSLHALIFIPVLGAESFVFLLVRVNLPFVQPDYCADSSDSVHHLRFHVHRRISGQISCRNWYRPNSRPTSMLVDVAPIVHDMANVYDVLNHSRTTIYCRVHMPMWLHALHRHLISRMWMPPPGSLRQIR